MDALFGLPRKKSTSISYRDPLHGDLFFYGQNSMDVFVEEASKITATPYVRNIIFHEMCTNI